MAHVHSQIYIYIYIYTLHYTNHTIQKQVRIFDLTDSGEWTLSAQWQAHRGAVTSICWAHPEFGSLLATAGSDHEAKLWEERNSSNHLHHHPSSNVVAAAAATTTANHHTTTPGAAAAAAGAGGGGARWTTKASLTEARRAVTCLEFAPRHWGLKLAVGSGDGMVRIYEAVDIMNLAQWPLAATLQCFADNNRLGVTCLSWCNGRFEPPTLVVGGSHLVIYRYSEAARAWQSILHMPPPEKGSVLHVAWAPNVGRRFHYIASAENQQLRIYKLLRQQQQQQQQITAASNVKKSDNKNTKSDNNNNKGEGSSSSSDKQHHLSLESSQTVDANAWRCQWNVTGTVLASSGDAGIV